MALKKVVINACYGGYSLSNEALLWLYMNGADITADVASWFGKSDPEYVNRCIKEFQESPSDSFLCIC